LKHNLFINILSAEVGSLKSGFKKYFSRKVFINCLIKIKIPFQFLLMQITIEWNLLFREGSIGKTPLQVNEKLAN